MKLNGFVFGYKISKQSRILVVNSAYVKLWQILEFHERVISALILVASFAKPKISSQLLRVNESLKFALRYKFIKKGEKGTRVTVCLQLRACKAKPPPYPLF